MDLNTELELSLYEELKSIHKSKKTEVILVCHTITSKFYIKKILKEYTIDVYNTLKNIPSSHLPEIVDIFEVEDKLIIIEEFINGKTLKEMLDTSSCLDDDTVIKYMIELCEVLNLLHSQTPPIIHRDIKPENIIISNENVLKIIDFDISRTYKVGESLDTTLLGTKGYASPEQFGFDQSDGRSDIYAMGIMMNVLTTGKHIKEVLNTNKLRNIILKCSELSPKDRYKDVLKLKDDLNKLLSKSSTISNEGAIKSKNISLSKTTTNEDTAFEESKYIKKNIVEKKSLIASLGAIIPGFRTKNTKNIILAISGYSFCVFGMFTSTNIPSFISNAALVSMILAYVALFCDFMDITKKLPLTRSKDRKLRIFGFIFYSIIIFLTLGSIISTFT